ncbi:Clathrin/coatomer adaptor, adaptin-like protein [Ostreococcus tauri]|uniref:Beta-adaptin-like protein n=1 Tax=Ostreococcus tauri TaxID=70448 RepID=A0A1Y5I1T1_OSTTA|nr:Clathrin/coatomer adaptor, adaptin-like protein [Ostreococcus tauri]
MTSGDARFFQTQRKGEIAEWRAELKRIDLGVQKQTIKKVIAAMTVGKDVSCLFPDIVQCMQTPNLELKKLIYLYLINYAKSEPELAILAVNTFIKDAQDSNPLIRALAVRTMGCIRVHRITEYLCDPLQLALTDSDPYVRKTAVICVAKLFDIDEDLVESRGFVDILEELIHNEQNPTVLSNAIAAFSEISRSRSGRIFNLDATLTKRLCEVLTQCTEWGQVYVLDALAEYSACDSVEASNIVERVSAHLQHSNGAVVLASVKVLMKNIQLISESARALVKMQISSSLVTLLGAELEVQFIALQTISWLLETSQLEFQRHLQVFYCRYNDPSYIKHAKLKILISIVSSENVLQVLNELREYSSEVDFDFVRQSVRAIGRCAIQFSEAADQSVTILLDLIGSNVNYIVQEAIVVMKDIIRSYPNQFEHTIPSLCAALSSLDQPEAKSALIWLVGEYASRIENATTLMETFCETFCDEPDSVQLQQLTSAVKTFLKQKDSRSQNVVQRLLRKSSCSENPDVRDRAFMYWRLLSGDLESAHTIVS